MTSPRQLTAMAPHVLSRVPPVLVPLHGMLGVLQRQGQTRTAPSPELTEVRGFQHPKSERERLGTVRIPRVSIPRKGKRRHLDADTAWCKGLQRLRAYRASGESSRDRPSAGSLPLPGLCGRSDHRELGDPGLEHQEMRPCAPAASPEWTAGAPSLRLRGINSSPRGLPTSR